MVTSRKNRRGPFATLEQVETRRLFAITYGLDTDLTPASGASSDPVIAAFNDLGAKAVRLYHSTTYAASSTSAISSEWSSDITAIQRFHAAGIQTTVVITPKEANNYSTYSAYQAAILLDNVTTYMTQLLATTFAGSVTAASVIDRWEIGNEVNSSNYYPHSDDAANYVTKVLKPSWDVLHPAGETVIGAGPTSTDLPASVAATPSAWLTALLNAGYTDDCDIANMHPYKSSNADDAIFESEGFIQAVRAKKSNMPVAATEFNALWGSEHSASQFATFDNNYQRWAKDNLESLDYYIFEYQNHGGTGVADAGYLVKGTSLVHNDTLYNMYKAWTTPASVAPSAPTLTVGTTTGYQVPLTWTASSNATGYVLQRRTSPTAAWTTLTSTTATSFTDSTAQPSTAYNYRVLATNASLSTPSNTLNVTTPVAGPTTTVSGRVFDDANNNGVYDSGVDANRSNDVLYVDYDNNGQYNGTDVAFRPGADGTFSFAVPQKVTGQVNLRVRSSTLTFTAPTAGYYAVALNGTAVANLIFAVRTAAPPANTLVSGRIYTDLNNDNAYDGTDSPRAYEGLYLDYNNNGLFDGTDVTFTPAGDGTFSFSVPYKSPGTATLRTRSSALTFSGASSYSITLNGTARSSLDFAAKATNAKTSIAGNVYQDLNANNVRDGGEAGVYFDVVYLDYNNNGIYDTGDVATRTDTAGNYTFANLDNTGAKLTVRLRGFAASQQFEGKDGYALFLDGTSYAGDNFGHA